MEVHINNNYVESFVSRYAKENASKVVKYLAIFGIHFLNSINKQNSQLSEMKALAKSIIKSRPNEGKHINHELRVLKDELEKLSKRVATNLGTIVPQQQETSDRLLGSKKQQEDLQQYSLNKSPSLPTKFDTKIALTQKPPTAWREGGDKKSSDRRGHRLDNIEEINEPTFEKESRTRVSPSNRERSITPKPNEIMHSRIEPRDTKNSFTRHHLDDSEAKDTFKEENVVYFQRKQKEEKYHSGKKETSKDPSQGKSPFFGNRRPQIEEHGHPQWSDTRELVSNLTVQSTKSPHFPTMKDDFLCKTPLAGTAQKEKENSRAIMSSATHKGDPRATKSSVKSSHKLESTHKNKKPVAAHDKAKKEFKPNKHSNLRASQPLATPNYKNVESKIKDEVNYHKELAKQYKKMKQSLGQSTGFDEDPMLRGSSRLEPSRDKMVYGDKESMRTTGGYEEDPRYRTSKVLESGTSTAQRSSLTMQQTMNPVEKTSASHHHKSRNDQENLGKNAESHHHRDSAGRGGILDIANSFLNSPLMQHISNIDPYMKDPASGQRTPVDMKSSNGFGRSINGVSDIEDDVRLQSSNGFQQSRYSNWGNGNYQPDKSVRSTGSILKDSTNRKYGEKDLRSSCNKDGASSLASSNFSNFLNEDMKGFYQKESLDQKKPKNSGMMVRFGSSENSSNVSFSGNEGPANADKKPNLHTNPKAQDGFSFDQNVFKNERMTMTQL